MRNRMLPPMAIFRALEDIAKIVASNESIFKDAIKAQSIRPFSHLVRAFVTFPFGNLWNLWAKNLG